MAPKKVKKGKKNDYRDSDKGDENLKGKENESDDESSKVSEKGKKTAREEKSEENDDLSDQGKKIAKKSNYGENIGDENDDSEVELKSSKHMSKKDKKKNIGYDEDLSDDEKYKSNSSINKKIENDSDEVKSNQDELVKKKLKNRDEDFSDEEDKPTNSCNKKGKKMQLADSEYETEYREKGSSKDSKISKKKGKNNEDSDNEAEGSLQNEDEDSTKSKKTSRAKLNKMDKEEKQNDEWTDDDSVKDNILNLNSDNEELNYYKIVNSKQKKKNIKWKIDKNEGKKWVGKLKSLELLNESIDNEFLTQSLSVSNNMEVKTQSILFKLFPSFNSIINIMSGVIEACFRWFGYERKEKHVPVRSEWHSDIRRNGPKQLVDVKMRYFDGNSNGQRLRIITKTYIQANRLVCIVQYQSNANPNQNWVTKERNYYTRSKCFTKKFLEKLYNKYPLHHFL